MLTELRNQLIRFGSSNKDILAIFLVGSYARGANRIDSDIDIVIVTSEQNKYIDDTAWIDGFGKIKHVDTEYYGWVTALRVFYDNYEIEFDIAPVKWIYVPLDAGTRRTLSDGYKIIYEKLNILKEIKKEVGENISS